MLPQRLRLRRNADFVSIVRSGRKVALPTMVLYARAAAEPHFGLIVGRNIGGAVERNQVKRRLRHGAADVMGLTRPMDVVVRALPRARSAKNLAADLASAYRRAEEVVS